jgi:hypothetical protein
MSRWSWLALVIVIAAGAVSLVYSYRLQTHHLPGLTPPDVQPSLLAL